MTPGKVPTGNKLSHNFLYQVILRLFLLTIFFQPMNLAEEGLSYTQQVLNAATQPVHLKELFDKFHSLDADVQEAICDKVTQWQRPDAAPYLRPLLKNADEHTTILILGTMNCLSHGCVVKDILDCCLDQRKAVRDFVWELLYDAKGNDDLQDDLLYYNFQVYDYMKGLLGHKDLEVSLKAARTVAGFHRPERDPKARLLLLQARIFGYDAQVHSRRKETYDAIMSNDEVALGLALAKLTSTDENTRVRHSERRALLWTIVTWYLQVPARRDDIEALIITELKENEKNRSMILDVFYEYGTVDKAGPIWAAVRECHAWSLDFLASASRITPRYYRSTVKSELTCDRTRQHPRLFKWLAAKVANNELYDAIEAELISHLATSDGKSDAWVKDRERLLHAVVTTLKERKAIGPLKDYLLRNGDLPSKAIVLSRTLDDKMAKSDKDSALKIIRSAKSRFPHLKYLSEGYRASVIPAQGPIPVFRNELEKKLVTALRSTPVHIAAVFEILGNPEAVQIPVSTLKEAAKAVRHDVQRIRDLMTQVLSQNLPDDLRWIVIASCADSELQKKLYEMFKATWPSKGQYVAAVCFDYDIQSIDHVIANKWFGIFGSRIWRSRFSSDLEYDMLLRMPRIARFAQVRTLIYGMKAIIYRMQREEELEYDEGGEYALMRETLGAIMKSCALRGEKLETIASEIMQDINLEHGDRWHRRAACDVMGLLWQYGIVSKDPKVTKLIRHYALNSYPSVRIAAWRAYVHNPGPSLQADLEIAAEQDIVVNLWAREQLSRLKNSQAAP